MRVPINLANSITAFRIVLTPVFVIVLMERRFVLALFVFLIAAVSDAADGLIARALKQKTTMGSYLDPIADKLLLSSAYIVLASIQVIPEWLAVVVISRDVLILMGVAVLTLFKGMFPMNPSVLSKFTTCAQIVTLLAVLVDASGIFTFSSLYILFWITTGITALSGLHYVYYGLQLLSENES